jgi:hypothetical protein
MHTHECHLGDGNRFQVSLLALLELTTICGALFAVSAVTGMAASVCLALMALLLTLRCGLGAVLLLAAALLAAGAFGPPQGGSAAVATVIGIGTALSAWFCLSRFRQDRFGRPGHVVARPVHAGASRWDNSSSTPSYRRPTPVS